MSRDFLKEVEEVSYPTEHLGNLARAMPLIMTAIERDGLPIESGLIDLGAVDEDLDVALFFFYWISETNQIIQNLNAVLTDMRMLPTNYVVLRGSPKTRYHLLVRMYFYEFYRFREIHHQVVKAAALRGFIERDEVEGARNAFHKAFEGTIELRNNLVHGSPIWKGKRHFDLNLLDHAWNNGLALKNLETGEIWQIGTVLQDICQHTADTLRDEGNRMSELLQGLVRIYVDLASEV